MRSNETSLERLRHLVYDEPTSGAWRKVCQVLEQMQADELEIGLQYVLAHFMEWPSWVRAYHHGRRKDFKPFLTNPPIWLSAVASLSFSLSRISAQDLEAFVQSERHIPDNLTHLYLASNDLGLEGVEVLVQSQHLASLQLLQLWDNAIGDQGASLLATAPHLTNLTHLDLRKNGIGPDGAKALAASDRLANVAHLDLAGNNLGDEGVEALAESPHLAHVTHLNLRDNDVGDAGIGALARATHLTSLAHLNLRGNTLTSAGVSALNLSPLHLSQSVEHIWTR